MFDTRMPLKNISVNAILPTEHNANYGALKSDYSRILCSAEKSIDGFEILKCFTVGIIAIGAPFFL